MDGYDALYRRLLSAAVNNEGIEGIEAEVEGDSLQKQQLEALLHPERQSAVVGFSDACRCEPGEVCECQLHCLFSAIERDADGKISVLPDCTGCGLCVERCEHGVFKERRDFWPLFDALHRREAPVYAMVAPAFLGQFGPEITVGKLRAAFKRLGFYGMIEVALFADILTLKEALEYDRLIAQEQDFVLASCCCPLWLALIRKRHGALLSHVPPSVSPMVACGRAIKHIHPNALTVFIGPCLAKKAEAKEKDIADAVDYVLTFAEAKDIFAAADIDPMSFEEDVRDHSSRAGRIYARTGGVSEAVDRTLAMLKGERDIPFSAAQADGMAQCIKLLEDIAKDGVPANFIEGMGCVGGCVGGPRALIQASEGAENVNAYAEHAGFETPVDNPYTFALLNRLGFDTVESLLRAGSIFERNFETKG